MTDRAVRISWRPSRVFADREAAGRALAEALEPVVARPCVVAAIPRGGVSVALPVAERLKAPLAVVYARKLMAPIAPELAFGALDEDGEVILDERTVGLLRLSAADIDRAKQRVAAEIRRRLALYGTPPLAHPRTACASATSAPAPGPAPRWWRRPSGRRWSRPSSRAGAGPTWRATRSRVKAPTLLIVGGDDAFTRHLAGPRKEDSRWQKAST